MSSLSISSGLNFSRHIKWSMSCYLATTTFSALRLSHDQKFKLQALPLTFNKPWIHLQKFRKHLAIPVPMSQAWTQAPVEAIVN